MKMRIIVVLLFLVVLLAYVGITRSRAREWKRRGEPWQPSAAEAVDFQAIQGVWEHVSTSRDGVETPGPPCSYSFDGDTMIVAPEGGQASIYTFRLDATHQPKHLTIVASWASGRVMTTEAIYELDGDTLRWAHLGGKRPEHFPLPGTPGTIITLRRVPQR